MSRYYLKRGDRVRVSTEGRVVGTVLNDISFDNTVTVLWGDGPPVKVKTWILERVDQSPQTSLDEQLTKLEQFAAKNDLHDALEWLKEARKR